MTMSCDNGFRQRLYYFQFVGTFSSNTKAMKCVQNNVHDSSDTGIVIRAYMPGCRSSAHSTVRVTNRPSENGQCVISRTPTVKHTRVLFKLENHLKSPFNNLCLFLIFIVRY